MEALLEKYLEIKKQIAILDEEIKQTKDAKAKEIVKIDNPKLSAQVIGRKLSSFDQTLSILNTRKSTITKVLKGIYARYKNIKLAEIQAKIDANKTMMKNLLDEWKGLQECRLVVEKENKNLDSERLTLKSQYQTLIGKGDSWCEQRIQEVIE